MNFDLDFVGPLRDGESPPLKQYNAYQPEYEAWFFAAEYKDKTRGGKWVRTRWKDTPERWARHFNGEQYRLVGRETRTMGGRPGEPSTPPNPSGQGSPSRHRPNATLTKRELEAIKRRRDAADILLLLWDIALHRAAVVRIFEHASREKPIGSIAADTDPVVLELRKLSCVFEYLAKKEGC